MSDISGILQAEVVFRAGNRCEYCRLVRSVGYQPCSLWAWVMAAGATAPDNLTIVWVQFPPRR